MTSTNITISDTPTDHMLVYRWQTPSALFLAMAGAFLVGCAICAVVNQSLIAWPLGSLAIVYSYFVGAWAGNRTVIRVDSSTLSVTHGPVPWLGNRVISLRDISSIYCENLQYRRNVTYSVRAVLKSGVGLTLLSSQDGETVRSLTREIERWVGDSRLA
jgi:hypothetical protein